MSWLGAVLFLWVLSRLVQRLYGALTRPRPRPKAVRYALELRQNWALALAHPVALARIPFGFAEPGGGHMPEDLVRALRPALLHLFGLRNDISEQQIRTVLPEKVRKYWFRIDLDGLRPHDEPYDAMAFACARVTFAVRVAALLGWLDEETQWYVLYQNAQRANDCFPGWEAYGAAWARGRQQWIADSRADSLGVAFTPQHVAAWCADSQHPWHQVPWQVPPFFDLKQEAGGAAFHAFSTSPESVSG